jgi:hypothetical protein
VVLKGCGTGLCALLDLYRDVHPSGDASNPSQFSRHDGNGGEFSCKPDSAQSPLLSRRDLDLRNLDPDLLDDELQASSNVIMGHAGPRGPD